MKKLLLLLIAANGVLSARVQAQDAKKYKDEMMPRWVIDANLMGGALTQDITTTNAVLDYSKPSKASAISGLKFSKGLSYGVGAQIGYFFDNRGHFGFGTGLTYQMLQGDVTMNTYNVDFLSRDASGNTFRQMINATAPVKEQLKINSLSIPVVFKFKYRFSEKIGISADAGILYNAMFRNNYTTNAVFNYQAIYAYDVNGNAITTAYDPNNPPSSKDLLITQSQYLATNPGGDVGAYFADQRDHGYNVGWGVQPDSKTGSVDFVQSNVGLIFNPTFCYFLNDRLSLNIGGYIQYQVFSNSPNGKHLTDGVGAYNSFLNNVTEMKSTSYGGTLGVRYYFGKLSDRDKDGVPNRFDRCPDVPGVAAFDGCPDTDGDGVPDSEDSCIDVPGLKHFHGCPDSDGDGIPNFDDACPYQAGPAKFMGCPDTDNDGIQDSEDKCPNEAGPASNDGCPIPPPPLPPPAPIREHDMNEPILFDVGKAKISDVSIPILAEAIMELNTHENAFIMIDGHTDITGGNAVNDALSFRRANAVKKYLIDMGANPKRMIAVGHGSREPIADNNTVEGRAKNRRVIMTLKHR